MRRLLHTVVAAGSALLALSSAPLSAQILGGEWILHDLRRGSYADARFGGALAAVGDVDGDGCTDFVVGAEFADPGEMNCGSAELFSGKTGVRIRIFPGGNNSDGFGASVAGPGDMNGDGIPDILVCAPRYGVLTGDNGAAYAYSGATGTRLWIMDGDAPGDNFGLALAAIGDFNGDGFADALVGAPDGNPRGANNAGYVQVHHGLTGAILLRLEGTSAGDRFGAALASPGDVTGDGVPDILVGAPGTSPSGLTDAGSVYLHSGATGALLNRWDGQMSEDGFGSRLAAAADVDGDGFGDALIGAPDADAPGMPDAGSAIVLSLPGGTVLHSWQGTAAGDRFGIGLAGGHDLDGDHVPDLAIGASGADPAGLQNAGTAWVFSGADGALIDLTSGSDTGYEAGAALALAEDLDGDRRADWLVGLPGDFSPTSWTQGSVHSYRHDPYLRLSARALSRGSGGVVIMDLTFPTEAAFHEFALLLSRTGTGPTVIGGLEVPLTRDALLTAALTDRLPAYFVGCRGVMSSAGKAGAALAPGPNQLPAALTGVTLYFAAITRPAGGLPSRTSSAVPLTILP